MDSPSRELMRALDAAGIANCHWKSNEHLSAALAGETDLDLLVDPGRRAEAQQVISACGFTEFDVDWSRRYPGLEDHLALDDSGRTHHLHLHFALDAGEPHLKSYRLPWVDEVLASRRLDTTHGVHVPAPEIETVLLLTRATMKSTLASRVRKAGLSAHDRRELDWLSSRCDPDGVARAASELLGPDAVPAVIALASYGDHQHLVELRRIVRERLRDDRRHSAPAAVWWRAVRTATWAGKGVLRRKLDQPVRFARQVPGGGAIVAVIGADGSGKSTLVKGLVQALRKDVDTMELYLGSGDGAVSLLRKPLVVLRRVRRSSGPSSAAFDEAGSRQRSIGPALVLWAGTLAWEKRQRVRRARIARRRGLVVVADRWPQAQFDGHGDGPLLAAWRGAGGVRGRIAEAERRVYEDAQVNGPDLVIRLDVSLDEAQHRRSDHDPVDLRRRIDLIGRLRFDASTTVDIDADSSADAVLRETLTAVWSSITDARRLA